MKKEEEILCGEAKDFRLWWQTLKQKSNTQHIVRMAVITAPKKTEAVITATMLFHKVLTQGI